MNFSPPGGLLTPLSRIDTDRQAVEQLVLQTTALPESGSGTNHTYALVLTGWCLSSILLLAGLYLHGINTQTLMLSAVIVACCFALHFVCVHILLNHRLETVNKLWAAMVQRGIELPSLAPTKMNLITPLISALAESKVKELSIADYSSDFIFALDTDCRIVCCNATSLRLLGYSAAELVGRSLQDLVIQPLRLQRDDDNDGSLSTAGSLAKDDSSAKDLQSRIFELTFLSKSGKLVDFSVQYEWSIRRQLFFACGTDITTVKENERTRHQFVSMISHDIKGALQSSLLTVENLSYASPDKLSPESVKERIQRVARNIQSVVDLCNELVDIEQGESSPLVLNKVQFDLKILADSCLSGILDLAKNRSIKLAGADVSVIVHADKQRIERVILNLLINAIKFSPTGGTVRIECKTQPSWVVVEVSDEGLGIPSHLTKVIFDRYFQLPGRQPKEPSMKGSGLGLAICKTFVEAHGGQIGVAPANPSGSVFWFTLPL